MGAKRSILRACMAAMGTPAAGGTVFLQQTFTGTPGTAITATTPTTGGVWSLQTGYSPASPNAIDNAGTALYSPTALGCYQNAATPASADYYVEAVIEMVTVISGDSVGVIGRADPAANTFYCVRYSTTSGAWGIFKSIAGTITTIGTNFTAAFSIGTSHTVRLTMTGSSISVSVDGTTVITAADSSITATGKAGMRLGFATGPTGGMHMASIVAST